MKFLVTLKDPSAIDYAVDDTIQRIELKDNYDPENDMTSGQLRYLLAKWFEYGEYLTVEIDTDTNKIKVLEV